MDNDIVNIIAKRARELHIGSQTKKNIKLYVVVSASDPQLYSNFNILDQYQPSIGHSDIELLGAFFTRKEAQIFISKQFTSARIKLSIHETKLRYNLETEPRYRSELPSYFA